MKEKDKLEEFLEKVEILSDEEVEAAGLRFDRRLRRMKLRRRVVLTSGVVAALVAIGLVIAPLFSSYVGETPGSKSEITVPTLILSNGTTVKLDREKAPGQVEMANIQVTDHHLIYDTVKYAPKADTLSPELRYNTLVIPAGYTYDLTLADGSLVTLNAGSRIKYPVEFCGELREVELSGEAFFRVEKSVKPFVVNVADAKIRVYGTQFNVKASRQTDLLETVLVEGSIGFTSRDGEERKIVPGEGLTYKAVTGEVGVQQVDTENATAWLNGVFKYQNRQLNFILEDISMWYGVAFESESDAADIELTMNLSRTTPLEETVSFLELITGRKIIKEGGRYIIK